MKKFITLAITLLLVFVCAFSASACNPSAGDGGSKTILNVYTYGGGFGTEWLRSLEQRFETDFAETSFEDGKVGVDVRWDDSKTNGMDEVNSATGSGIDVYFCQEINYYDASII